MALTRYAVERLTALRGVTLLNTAPYGNEVALRLPIPAEKVVNTLISYNCVPGFPVSRYYNLHGRRAAAGLHGKQHPPADRLPCRNHRRPAVKTIFAKSVSGRHAENLVLEPVENAPRAADMLPAELLRKQAPRLPECSELDVVRHFTALSRRNYSVDANFYPLGSCTMKYNPKFTEQVAGLPGFTRLHPMLAQLGRGASCVQGGPAGALRCRALALRTDGHEGLHPAAHGRGQR